MGRISNFQLAITQALISGARFAAEASKNLLHAESLSDPLDRGCLSRRRKISRGAAEARGMFAKK